MSHLEIIRPNAPPSRWSRFLDSLRSITLGPYGTKDPALARLFGGNPVSSGVTVSEETALTLAAVWQAVSLIAGDIGSLPLHLYKRDKNNGRERYTDHPLYYVLHDAPNPEMTSMIFRETLQAHLLTWGNAYAEIERDGAGRPVGLWPLLPFHVTPYREAGRLRYRVAGGNGGSDVILEARDVLHVPGLGFDGILGYSPIRQARESLGLLAAAEKFGSTFFGNGSTFGGVLTHPKMLSDKAQASLRESINAQHQGPQKAHRFLILEEGMAYSKLGVDPNDAQFLETRKFQVTEVCRWFNLSPSKLRELDNSSVRANIEQDAIDYVTNTLRPWCVRWEQEVNRKLISPRERYIQYAEFALEGLLRGDLASRYAAYAVGRQWGWLSADDVLMKENMNPLPNGAGKIYLVPTNMAPADRINEIIDKQVAPTPPPVVAPPAGGNEPEPEDDEAERQWLSTIETQAAAIASLQAEQARLAEERDEAAGRAARAEDARRTAQADIDAAEIAYREAVDAQALAETAHAAKVAELTAQMEALTGTTRADVDAAGALAQQAIAAQVDADAKAAAAEDARQQALADLTMAQAANAQALAAVESANQATADRITALITANRAVMVEALGRLVRREAEKARSKRATPEKLRAWAETFYEDHEADLWADSLRPIVAVHLTIMGSDRSVEDVTRALVAQHMATSQRQIVAVAASDPAEYQRALDRTLDRWETQRAGAAADDFVLEEIAYVRSIS